MVCSRYREYEGSGETEGGERSRRRRNRGWEGGWRRRRGGLHPVFSVVPLCSSLIFNVEKKSQWLQSGCVKPPLLLPPSSSSSFSFVFARSLGGDWQFTECPHVILGPAAAASSAAFWEKGGRRRGKGKEAGKMARWMEAEIHLLRLFHYSDVNVDVYMELCDSVFVFICDDIPLQFGPD